MARPAKPTPRCDELNGVFYAYAAQRNLRIQQCDDCGTWRHMPRHTCAHCGSAQWQWMPVSGHATLYSWTVTHRSFHPAFDDDVPYAIVVAELEEGVRMVSRIIGATPETYVLGMPLQLRYIEQEGAVLPVFEPAAPASD